MQRLVRSLLSVVALLSLDCVVRAGGLIRQEWTMGGVVREALVSVPSEARDRGAALVFAFHGHGGTMQHASRSFPIHRLWPEAIVVFPQGLPTPGRLTDPNGEKTGWQSEPGALDDRDLKFVDAMLASLRQQQQVDDKRIFATGHSNGGAFTYLLWAERGDVFAALAPSAAVLARGSGNLIPKPVLHIGSPQDPLVKFAWQARMIDHVLTVNGCGRRDGRANGYTVYPSSKGTVVATFLHAEGHAFPEAATELIVRFFGQQALP